MLVIESVAKPMLVEAGIPVPRSYVVNTIAGVEQAAGILGPCLVKALVPLGRRDRAAGIKPANTAQAAVRHAERILKMTIGGFKVERLLIEETVPVAAEMYAAVMTDPVTKTPQLLFSGKAGVDRAAKRPASQLMRFPVDIRTGPEHKAVVAALPKGLPINPDAAAALIMRLYDIYRRTDAVLIEVDPLVLTRTGTLMALECHVVKTDSGAPDLSASAAKAGIE